MAAIDFAANESRSFIVEWDWARESITPDWSVTAWAEYGTVSVTHNDGWETDSLPFTPRIDPSSSSASTVTTTTEEPNYLPAPVIVPVDEM